MASVTLKNVYKIYAGGVTAVTDFCLDIEDKEFIILVGPSGCGKSTTLRMIAGLEEISKGELYIGDQLANDVAPKDRDIAMVFQNYALFPWMSALRNVEFGVEQANKELHRGLTKGQVYAVARDYLDRVGMGAAAGKYPYQLSGGEQQRIAVARALLNEPELIIADEPTGNLDPNTSAEILRLLLDINHRHGTAVVMATHDYTMILKFPSRTVKIDGGTLHEVQKKAAEPSDRAKE